MYSALLRQLKPPTASTFREKDVSMGRVPDMPDGVDSPFVLLQLDVLGNEERSRCVK